MNENKHIKKIVSIFESNSDLKVAHQQASMVLKETIKDNEFLMDVIRYNLSDPDFLKKPMHYPTLSLSIFQNENLDILINIFPSLPDGDTNTSHHSIHHHGNLMLSTIGVSGPGYYTMVFNGDYNIQPSGEITNLQIDSEFQNDVGQYTFCPDYVPHVVFYPKSMSSTLLIWTKNKKTSTDKIKQLPIPKGIKKGISKILHGIGLSKQLNLNTTEYLDFYPEDKRIMGIKTRIRYPNPNSNENFIRNIVHFLQSVEFTDYSFLEELLNKETTSKIEAKWIQKFLNKEKIDPVFEQEHLNISKMVNIKKQDVYDAIRH